MPKKDSPYPVIVIPSRAEKQRKNKLYAAGIVTLGLTTLMGISVVSTIVSQENPLPLNQMVDKVGEDLKDNIVTASEAIPKAIEATKKEVAKIVEPPEFPKTVELTVGKGDTLGEMLNAQGIGAQATHNIIQAMRKTYDPRSIKVGQSLALTLDKAHETDEAPFLKDMVVQLSKTKSVEVAKTKDSYKTTKVEIPLVTTVKRGGGEITNSFYVTAERSGVPANTIIELMNAYSFDVDFQRDIYKGHKLDVLYEQYETEDGNFIKGGNVLYAQLDMGGKSPITIYYYEDSKGRTDYFNKKGESVRKALLRTPVPGARISSGYGKRRHPILGYNKMHRGIDFAAPTGTPVYAAGDGKISYKGRKGGYGNYLRIKHNGTYATAYAHLHRFAKGMYNGKRVKQGQIVAYVGTTGRSTGPHLHYEIHKWGKQVNPRGVKFRTGIKLAGKDLKNFKANIQKVHAMLDQHPIESALATNAADQKTSVN